MIGPNTGLIGISNLSTQQILFANLLAIPLNFIFSVLYLVITTPMLESFIAERHAEEAPILVDLKWKIGICTACIFFGSSFFVFIFNISVVMSFASSADVALLTQKNLAVFIVSFLIAILISFCLSSKLLRQSTAPSSY